MQGGLATILIALHLSVFLQAKVKCFSTNLFNKIKWSCLVFPNYLVFIIFWSKKAAMQSMVDALHPTYVPVTMVGLALVAANAYLYQDANMVNVNRKLFNAFVMT